MAVEVRLPTVLRSHAGGSAVVSVDGATIGEVLSKLVAEYPGMAGQVLTDEGTLHKFVNIYVNDDDVRYLRGPGHARARRRRSVDPAGRGRGLRPSGARRHDAVLLGARPDRRHAAGRHQRPQPEPGGEASS